MLTNTPMLYGVPIPRMQKALREEMELMGLGDEQIRKAIYDHPVADLFHAIQTIIQKPEDEHLSAMQQWLRGEGLKSSEGIARKSLNDIKGILNASTSNKNRSARTRGSS